MQDPWLYEVCGQMEEAWMRGLGAAQGWGEAGWPLKGSEVKLELIPLYSLRWSCFFIFNFFTQEDKRASREIWVKKTMCKEY